MKRKIIKLAEKTLVVSLPVKWICAQQLKKGDEIELISQDERLIIVPQSAAKKISSVSLSLKGITERVLRWKISSYHKKGYDEITLLHYSEEQYAIVQELTKDLFVGFLVKEKTQLRIVVGQIAAVDVSEFDSTLRRGFRHLTEMANELYVAFENKDQELLAGQLEHEKNNNKITNFCERLLNKHLIYKEQGHFWYVLAWNLEKCADSLKYIAKHYLNSPAVSAEALSFYKKVLVYLDRYTKLLYSFSFSSLESLSSQKRDLEAKAIQLLEKGDSRDRIFVHYIHQLILQLADFSASMIAIAATNE